MIDPRRGAWRLSVATRITLLALLACLVLNGSRSVTRAQEPLRPPLTVNGYRLDTTSDRFDLADRAAWSRSATSRYAILQFNGPIQVEWQAAAQALGVVLDDYLPDFGFVARIPPDRQAAVRALPFVTYVGPFEPAFRVSRSLDTKTAADATVNVGLFAGESVDATAKIVDDLGGQVIRQGDSDLQARLPADRLPTLAAVEGVRWVEEARPMGVRNSQASWRIQSGAPNSRPLWDHGLLGQGQIIGLADSGIDIDHECFYDPARPVQVVEGGQARLPDLAHRKIVNYWRFIGDTLDVPGHGTHVAGTLACDTAGQPGASGNVNATGMAPQARLSFTDLANGTYFPVPLVSDVAAMFANQYADGARIHNDSWGEFHNEGQYTGLTRVVDDAMWHNKDLLILFANGNGLRVEPPATAKNIVSVGATTLSRGPTADGRIKPTLLGPAPITSALSNQAVGAVHRGYTPMTGTSVASPAVAGGLALVRQYFTDGWYPGGVAGAGRAMTPSAALLKATLLAGTTEVTSNGGDTLKEGHVPNNTQGWGLINLDGALSFAGETRGLWVADETLGLSTGQQATFKVNVTSAAEPLRVVLAWTDYPAAYGSLGNVVNDLDLKVVAPDGHLYLGNVTQGLNPTYSVPGGRADRVNVEEGIFLPRADLGLVTGTYTVTVSAYNTPHGPQPYALAVVGGLAQTPQDSQPPTIVTTSPPDGATGVPATASLWVTFSEEMAQETVAPALSIMPPTPGAITWDGPTLRFAPDAPLTAGTTYTVTLSTAATDLAGNMLGRPLRLSFTTAAGVGPTPTPGPLAAPAVLIGPSDLYTTLPASFYAFNLGGDRPLRYRFDWGDGALATSEPAAPGEWARLSHAWSAAGSYSVRIQAVDDGGRVSPWSALRAVRIADPPLEMTTALAGDAAARIAPRSGDTQQAQSFTSAASSLPSVTLALAKSSLAPTFRLLVSVTTAPVIDEGPLGPSGAGRDMTIDQDARRQPRPGDWDAGWGLVTPQDVVSTDPTSPSWVRVVLNRSLAVKPGERVYVILRPYEDGAGAYLWRTKRGNPYRRGEFYAGPNGAPQADVDALLRVPSAPVPNLPPTPAGLVAGPTHVDSHTQASFQAIADDPDGNASHLVFDWGDGVETAVVAPPGGGVVQATHVWTRPGLFNVRAQTTDVAGLTSAWSAALPVTVIGVDQSAPIISAMTVTSLTVSSAVVTWTTDEASAGAVEYGTTPAYGDTISGGSITTRHVVPLIGLTAGTTYHYRVTATDSLGNRGTSQDLTFRTLSPGGDPPLLADVHTRYVTSTSARITWRTDRPTTSYVDVSVPPGEPVAFGSGELTTEHSIELTGLAPSLPYHYRARSEDALGNQALSAQRIFTTRAQNPWTIYHSFARANSLQAEVQWLADEFPEVVTLTSIGTSIQGRPLVALKLSDNPTLDEAEPEVILTAGIHGREWIAVETLLYATYELVNRYGIDPSVSQLLNEREVWVLPMLNPDGRVIDGYDDGNDPARSRSWRKNGRVGVDDGVWNICDGVDLNRNFELGWGIGASTSPCHEEYQGATPWSEPETRAYRDFIRARLPAVVADYHAFGNVVYYPWGYLMTPTPDDARYKAVAAELAALLPYATAQQSSLYGAEGGVSDDWVYAETRALTFTFEIGAQDRPEVSRILPTITPYLAVTRRLLELAADPWGDGRPPGRR